MDILGHFNLHLIQVGMLKRYNEVLKNIVDQPSGADGRIRAGTAAKIKLVVT